MSGDRADGRDGAGGPVSKVSRHCEGEKDSLGVHEDKWGGSKHSFSELFVSRADPEEYLRNHATNHPQAASAYHYACFLRSHHYLHDLG